MALLADDYCIIVSDPHSIDPEFNCSGLWLDLDLLTHDFLIGLSSYRGVSKRQAMRERTTCPHFNCLAHLGDIRRGSYLTRQEGPGAQGHLKNRTSWLGEKTVTYAKHAIVVKAVSHCFEHISCNAVELRHEQIFKGGGLSRDIGIMLPHGLMRICACYSFPTALPTHAWIPGQSLIPGECWRGVVLHNTEYAYGGYVAWLLQGSKSLHADRPIHWLIWIQLTT
ncbi:hypothetical protein PCH_Pc22g19130 [Penicillium rubens Wisconsin 54-1255]|uniref:Uncharacterized protein n=1 Tax=Penicillium rubens (strain ATCC 28089 / DSM 1075 / NRRL 1951 / Wisconsin 54-1255) TaxID=500485 RepID=B6HVP6_PENRW|nr:hypothetical protein PCH_Pc22g19130 [Penicillium rubens Wisconsin 54-1255]